MFTDRDDLALRYKSYPGFLENCLGSAVTSPLVPQDLETATSGSRKREIESEK